VVLMSLCLTKLQKPSILTAILIGIFGTYHNIDEGFEADDTNLSISRQIFHSGLISSLPQDSEGSRDDGFPLSPRKESPT
jgi:hypothetical protein